MFLRLKFAKPNPFKADEIKVYEYIDLFYCKSQT